MNRRAPDHLVVASQPRHGVSILARQLALATGARTTATTPSRRDLPVERTHLHFCDRLLAATPEDAAAEVERLAGRGTMTVTLHDVPAPSDGESYERRAAAYRRVLAATAGWVVSSHSELDRAVAALEPAEAGAVIPLPLVEPRRRPEPSGPVAPGGAVLGVLGWVYPGKGHAELLDAAATLGDDPASRPRVVALGAPAPGHEDLVDALREHARDVGVDLEVTGWLRPAELAAAVDACDLGVAGHRNVSASGSVNSWVAAGHVPLVRDSAYAREMADLRPGTLTTYDDATLAAAVADRLAHPMALPEAPLPWTLRDVALAYRRWWDGRA